MVDKYPMKTMYNGCNLEHVVFVLWIFSPVATRSQMEEVATCGIFIVGSPSLQNAILNYWDTTALQALKVETLWYGMNNNLMLKMYNGEMANLTYVICYLWADLELTTGSNILCYAVPTF